MYTAKIENKNGELLQLTQRETEWQVVEITGLNPPPAQVNLTALAGQDGSVFNSSKLDTRNIVITLRIRGDVEVNRQLLYRFFKTKEECKFYFKNENRDVFIRGRVETCEVNLFEWGQAMQASLICPQPYFRAIEELVADLSGTLAAFVFPFSINIGDPIPFGFFNSTKETDVLNDTESETGVELTINFDAAVSKVEIKNISAGDDMILQYSFQKGDTVLVNTNTGEKSVRLLRDGIYSNLFGAVKKGSVFFQLISGENVFSFLADGGENNNNVRISISYRRQYRGV